MFDSFLLHGISVNQLVSSSSLWTWQETWFLSLGLEDPLEKEMTTHSSIPAWKIPWTEEPGVLRSTGLQESNTTKRINHHHHHLVAQW